MQGVFNSIKLKSLLYEISELSGLTIQELTRRIGKPEFEPLHYILASLGRLSIQIPSPTKVLCQRKKCNFRL
jgi:hypothetical protein